MYETLTAKERRTLERKMDDAWDDITRLIDWAQSHTRGINPNEFQIMRDMRFDILYAAYETPPPYAPTHEFHDNGTDPGNCCYCHTFHTTPRYADGTAPVAPL